MPIAAVRAFLEISVVTVGWYLGGTVGLGTLLFAFGIGPAVALGLYLTEKIFINKKNPDFIPGVVILFKYVFRFSESGLHSHTTHTTHTTHSSRRHSRS